LETKLTIALDAMGGDHAPASVIEGAALAATRFPDLRFLFFGDAARIDALLPKFPSLAGRFEITHTDQVIASHEKPSVAVRQGKGSSMWQAIASVKEGRAAAVVSAGNTGALMAISKLVLRTLPGIYRPAICAQMPTKTGLCAMLDLGANSECDAGTLFQFAVMGNAFARAVLHKETPTIGLLNIGSEQGKGNETLNEAFGLLSDARHGLKFEGFVEANDINAGRTDVVVTDGFTGNVALKMSEGTANLIRAFLKETFSRSFFSKLGYMVAKSSFDLLGKRLDPRKYNGAMFIGLNGISVKSHGGADGYAFYHAIKVAVDLAGSNVNARIIREIEAAPLDHPSAVAEAAPQLQGAI
jgi:glycerol-3-phosphate acyltransferase PlsX